MHDNTELDRLINAFDQHEMRDLTLQLVPQLTVEQRHIFDVVTDAALNNKGGLFMIDAPAGTGKASLSAP